MERYTGIQNAEVSVNDDFCGEILFCSSTTELTVCTPEADYIFVLKEKIEKPDPYA